MKDHFQPPPILSGGHLQTLLGLVARARLSWPFRTEDEIVGAPEDVRLLVRASWHPDSRDRPTLLLIHGLEGSDRSTYMLSMGILAYRAGWHVLRLNMRGCGDSLALCPRLYNAGLTSDLLAVTKWLADRVSRFAVMGFSLGANLALLTAARESRKLPRALRSIVAVCPPLDMSLCADALESRSNWPYQFRFVTSLRRSYRARQRLSPDLYERGRERGLTTLRQFDDVVTAFYGGYRGAEDYYRSVSPGPRLPNIDRPTLVLASGNDPFIPVARRSPSNGSRFVRFEITPSGGHVGYVGRCKAPGSFWAAERAMRFLGEHSDTSGSI